MAWNIEKRYNKNNIKVKFGYLKETNKIALNSGYDKETKLNRTGLEEYLKVIFPDINDWIYDKPINNSSKKRLDYRSEFLKLVIEIDGLPHYQNPDVIMNDNINTEFYKDLGYKVIRIPYFIQLTNNAVYTILE